MNWNNQQLEKLTYLAIMTTLPKLQISSWYHSNKNPTSQREMGPNIQLIVTSKGLSGGLNLHDSFFVTRSYCTMSNRIKYWQWKDVYGSLALSKICYREGLRYGYFYWYREKLGQVSVCGDACGGSVTLLRQHLAHFYWLWLCHLAYMKTLCGRS